MRALLINILLLISTLSFSQRLKYDYWDYSKLYSNGIFSVSCYEYNNQDSTLLYELSIDTSKRQIAGRYYHEDLTIHGISAFWSFEKKYNINDSLISFKSIRDEDKREIKQKRQQIEILRTRIENTKRVFSEQLLLRDTFSIIENTTIIYENDTSNSENIIYKCLNEFEYDKYGKLIKQFSTFDSIRYIVNEYQYDTLGNLIKSYHYRKGKIHEIKNISYDNNQRRNLEIDTTNLDFSNPMEVRRIIYNYPNDTTIEELLVYFSLKHHPDSTFKRIVNNQLQYSSFTSLRRNYQNHYEYLNGNVSKWIFENSDNDSTIRTYEYNNEGYLVSEKLESRIKDVNDKKIRYFYNVENKKRTPNKRCMTNWLPAD